VEEMKEGEIEEEKGMFSLVSFFGLLSVNRLFQFPFGCMHAFKCTWKIVNEFGRTKRSKEEEEEEVSEGNSFVKEI